MRMDVCPEEEAASVRLHRGAFKTGDHLYAFLLVCERISNASASGLLHAVLSLSRYSHLSVLRSLLKGHLSKAFSLTSPIYKMMPPPTFFPFLPHSVFLLAFITPWHGVY